MNRSKRNARSRWKVQLRLPANQHSATHALTSLPWPAGGKDLPSAIGVDSQAVPLFEPIVPVRQRRFLLLCASEKGMPSDLAIVGGKPGKSLPAISELTVHTLREQLDSKQYVYRECEARLKVAGRTIALRMGLRPNRQSKIQNPKFSWWQWVRAERLWSGPVAEAWRVGGHLVPYTTDARGKWDKKDLRTLGEQIAENCGDVLHGDLFLIVWRSGLVQVTAHFKAGYFHYWPKPIQAFPVILVKGGVVVPPSGGICPEPPEGGTTNATKDGLLLQPWTDLRVLANKTKENELIYLEPARKDTIPPGVSRSYRFTIGGEVARYQVPSSWYRECGVIETDVPGPAAEMASRSAALIREHTQLDGFDAGLVWRYLRRDLRSGVPQEDCAEWEGNLAQAMFTLAYQRGESPAEHWPLYLEHAYHAADIAVYHGSWMGRLEGSAVFTAPLPKFRFGGLLFGYLETGDPYLLDVARSLAGVYMAMEAAQQPRAVMGRDAYPLACLMSLWDYTGEALYLDFARQTALRLLATQEPDGGFDGQAGAGVLTGVSCITHPKSISFGSGLLAPIALIEWATRDKRWPANFKERLRRWADLMVRLQPVDGVWLSNGSKGNPYALIGGGALFSLVKAGELLNDKRCREAVRRFLHTMNATRDCVSGTHAFLGAMYAHVADATLSRIPRSLRPMRSPAGTGNRRGAR